MSHLHIEALSTLANMHYIATQIHARTPIVDEDGESIVDHMNKATDHLTQSMAQSLSSSPENSLFSLKNAYTRTQGVLSMIQGSLENQIVKASEGKLPTSVVKSNLIDGNAFVDHQTSLLQKGKEIVANEQNKASDRRDMTDNAREVIDQIADDNNLLLPGSWRRQGNDPAPNGE